MTLAGLFHTLENAGTFLQVTISINTSRCCRQTTRGSYVNCDHLPEKALTLRPYWEKEKEKVFYTQQFMSAPPRPLVTLCLLGKSTQREDV